MSPNMKAYLDMLSVSEGTATSPATKCQGYDVIVTGVDGKPEIFTDFTRHPFVAPPGGVRRLAKVINRAGLLSTAAGRYQILAGIAGYYMTMLGLKDFSPASQDAIAMQLIRECHATVLIDAGRFTAAATACRSRWASLPGAGYPGQPEQKMATLQNAYVAAGGTLA